MMIMMVETEMVERDGWVTKQNLDWSGWKWPKETSKCLNPLLSPKITLTITILMRPVSHRQKIGTVNEWQRSFWLSLYRKPHFVSPFTTILYTSTKKCLSASMISAFRHYHGYHHRYHHPHMHHHYHRHHHQSTFISSSVMAIEPKKRHLRRLYLLLL